MLSVLLSGQITKRFYLDTPIITHDPTVTHDPIVTNGSTQKIVEFTMSDEGVLVVLGTSRKVAWKYDKFMCKVKGEQN